MIYKLIFFILLIISSYFDLKRKRISYYLIIPILLLSTCYFLFVRRLDLANLLLFSIILVLKVIVREGIGGGDIIFIFALCLIFPEERVTKTLLLASIFAIISFLVNNIKVKSKEKEAFLPFLLLAFISSFLGP